MNERIDHLAPPGIVDEDQLEQELVRLRASVRELPPGARDRRRRGYDLDRWSVRVIDAFPETVDPTVSPEDFEAVSLPFTTLDEYLHFRHVVPPGVLPSQRLRLCFEAADYESRVFVDGVHVTSHEGYVESFDVRVDLDVLSPHTIDIVTRRADDYVRWSGELDLANRGDLHGKGLGSVAEEFIAAGCGLLGAAFLDEVPPVAIEGERVSTDHHGLVTIDVVLVFTDDAPDAVELSARVTDGDDTVGEDSLVVTRSDGTATLRMVVSDPHVWSPASPYLYALHVEVAAQGAAIDSARRAIGLRTIARNPDGSLSLNGSELVLRGTTSIACCWNAAWSGNEEAVLRQLLIAKALFCNTLRVHVAVLPELFYECADRVGLLIYQDAPVQWHCFNGFDDRVDIAVGQLQAVARRVRNHPSVVALSVSSEMHMKEPFHDSDIRYITEAARALEGDDQFIAVQDWSGPSRPRILPQSVHDYAGYFHGTVATREGVFDKAHEMLDSLDTRAIHSEYGAGAMPSWGAMLAAQRAHVSRGEAFPLPRDPDDHFAAETGLHSVVGELVDNHERMVGWQASFNDLWRESNDVQAMVLYRQTGRLRRDRARFSGIIHHYLQSAAPAFYNPWLDLHVIDSTGCLTGGFNALREAFRPVAMELIGLPAHTRSGTELNSEVWIYSDLGEETPATLVWEWKDGSQTVRMSGTNTILIPPMSSMCVETLNLPIPRSSADLHEWTLVASLSLGGHEWQTRVQSVDVHADPVPFTQEIHVLGDCDAFRGRAPQFSRASPLPSSDPSACVPVVVTPDVLLDAGTIDRLRRIASQGGTVVLLERQPGDDLQWLGRTPPSIARDHRNDIASPDLAMHSRGFRTGDLSYWNTIDGRVVTHPLIAVDQRGTVTWARCGHRLQLSALQEYRVGAGRVFVCQLHVWTMLSSEPSAEKVLRELLFARSDGVV